MNEIESKNDTGMKSPARSRLKWFLLAAIIVIPGGLVLLHEVSMRKFQGVVCVTCHEMKDPVRKWKESGAAKNHSNCAGCHFDKGFDGWIDSYQAAATEVVEHFKRDPAKPLTPPEEPLFLDEDKEPGYWSLVPNHRCFQCHDAPNHKEIDQPIIHAKLIKNISLQPCKDCHNHEMRKGQKFYEKVLTGQKQAEGTGVQD